MPRKTQKQLAKTLKKLNYTYLEVNSFQDLLNNLRNQLKYINNEVSLSNSEWDRFIEKNICIKREDYVDKLNKIQWTDFKKSWGSVNINFVDKKNIYRNKLQFIDNYFEASENQPPFVTILMNGLPMVHIEIKPREESLERCFDKIPRESSWKDKAFGNQFNFFDFIEIFIISNGKETKYFSCTTWHHLSNLAKFSSSNRRGTIGSYFFASNWTDKDNNLFSDLESFVSSFLDQKNLLHLILKYSVLVNAGNKRCSKLQVMRPYQIYAVEAICKKLEETYAQISEGKKDTSAFNFGGGYIWHATGSGKTLTSFKACKAVSELKDMKIDKVLFVVDRNDLDLQTQIEFGNFEAGCFSNAKSSPDLKERFLRNDVRFITTTIQKLYSLITKKLKSDSQASEAIFSQHVVIIFDECHRTQFGKMREAINKSFLRSHMFGFTGTPIFDLKKEVSHKDTTEKLFGDMLHKYNIYNAIIDQKVLEFKIGYIGFKPNSGSRKKETEINKRDESLKENDFCNDKRVSNNVTYILENFDFKTLRPKVDIALKRERGHNSILAVSSIKLAKKYYSEFKKQIPTLETQENRDFFVTTIFTSQEENSNVEMDESENPEVIDVEKMTKSNKDFLLSVVNDYNNSFPEKKNFSITSGENLYRWCQDVSYLMKQGKIDLLIVVNMFLTGFDSPKTNTLWVDKYLSGHSLIQAFSRTNRIENKKKTHGNIELFRTSKEDVDIALRRYVGEDFDILTPTFEELYSKGYVDKRTQTFQPSLIQIKNELNDYLAEDIPLQIGPTEKKFVNNYHKYLDRKNRLITYDEFRGREVDTETEDKWRDRFYVLQEIKNANARPARIRGSGSEDDQDEGDSSCDWDGVLQLSAQDVWTPQYIVYVLTSEKELEKFNTEKEKNEWKSHLNRMVNASAQMKPKSYLIDEYIDLSFERKQKNKRKIEFKDFVAKKLDESIVEFMEKENCKDQEHQIKKFLAKCFRGARFFVEEVDESIRISRSNWMLFRSKVESVKDSLGNIFEVYYFGKFLNDGIADSWLKIENV